MERETLTDKDIIRLTEDKPVDPSVRESIQNYIAGQTMPKKMELAIKGNREVRLILSRDPNKMIARTVFSSPRLSASDVMEYVHSPLTNEDLLREIGGHKEWMSNHQIMKALVSNPRTPLPVAMKHLVRLPGADLNFLSRNRNLHAFLRREAKRLSLRSRK